MSLCKIKNRNCTTSNNPKKSMQGCNKVSLGRYSTHSVFQTFDLEKKTRPLCKIKWVALFKFNSGLKLFWKSGCGWRNACADRFKPPEQLPTVDFIQNGYKTCLVVFTRHLPIINWYNNYASHSVVHHIQRSQQRCKTADVVESLFFFIII